MDKKKWWLHLSTSPKPILVEAMANEFEGNTLHGFDRVYPDGSIGQIMINPINITSAKEYHEKEETQE